MTVTEIDTGPPLEGGAAAEALSDRLFGEGLGALHILCVYLGDRLGLFRELHAAGPLTAVELAARTGTDPWYVREWVQAEATAGLLEVDGGDVDAGGCRLAAGVADVLVDEASPFHLAGLPVAVAAVGSVLPRLVEAFRTGAGVPYAAYGPEGVEAVAALNRPGFVHSLVPEWLPAMDDVVARLNDPARPARVADLGCGAGWAAIAVAAGFPHVEVTGLDADEESIARARRHAAAAGVAHRVDFEVADITGAIGGPYDLVLMLECVHDLARPVEALTRAREALAPGGAVFVADERTADRLTPGDPIELFFATASVLWCLPQSRAFPDAEATGTVMREATFRDLAARAGFASVDVLAIDHPFFRFYRLSA